MMNIKGGLPTIAILRTHNRPMSWLAKLHGAIDRAMAIGSGGNELFGKQVLFPMMIPITLLIV